MKQTIAQELGITQFPFEIKDGKGNIIYMEDKNGYWERREIDSEGREVYYEDCNAYFIKTVYDEKGNEIYSQNPFGRIYKEPAPQAQPKAKPKPEPTPTITLQHCLDRGFTVEKIEDPIYKEQHGKDYMLCYLKLSKRHMIDYCNTTYRCMVYKVDSEGTILERKYLKDVGDLDFYIRFLASEKVLKKLSKLG